MATQACREHEHQHGLVTRCATGCGRSYKHVFFAAAEAREPGWS